jgi:hypothetical protein
MESDQVNRIMALILFPEWEADKTHADKVLLSDRKTRLDLVMRFRSQYTNAALCFAHAQVTPGVVVHADTADMQSPCHTYILSDAVCWSLQATQRRSRA